MDFHRLKLLLGTSLEVQGLRLCLPTKEAWVQYLFRELSSHMLWGVAKIFFLNKMTHVSSTGSRNNTLSTPKAHHVAVLIYTNVCPDYVSKLILLHILVIGVYALFINIFKIPLYAPHVLLYVWTLIHIKLFSSLSFTITVCILRQVWLFAIPWTVARHTPVHGILQARILE